MFETKVKSNLKPVLQGVDVNWVVCELGNSSFWEREREYV